MADYKRLSENLRGLIDQRRREKAEEDNTRRTRNDEDRTKILEGIGKDVASALSSELTHFLKDLAEGTRLTADELKKAFDGMQINVPSIKVPKPEVTVNVPPTKFPEFKFPETQPFPERFKIDDTNPIPVILTDTKGKRYGVSEFAGGGGGKINKQYQERDVASLITGLAILAEGASDELFPLQVGSGVSDRALRVVHATDVAMSIVAGATLGVQQVSGSAWSVSITGSTVSQIVVGDDVADAADAGGAPIKVGGIARTANPSAVGAGDRVAATFDDVGRQVVYPYQVRDLISTAYATLSTNTETNLLAGVSGVFLDLVYVAFANTSAGAVDIDIRDSLAAGILATITVPADATAGWAPVVPIPQNEAANSWTVDFNTADVSGTTVFVNALFIRNV